MFTEYLQEKATFRNKKPQKGQSIADLTKAKVWRSNFPNPKALK